MRKIIVLIILAQTLSGCALKTGLDMMSSKDRYQDCLIKNTENIQICEGYKKAFEADKSAWNSMHQGFTTTTNVRIQENQDSN